MRCCRIAGILAAVVAFAAAQRVEAAPASKSRPVRIGYVDLDRVAANSQMVKERVSEVERQLLAKQKDYRAKAQKLRDLRRRYSQQKAILTEQQKRDLEGQIRKLRDDLDYLEYQANKILGDTSRNVIEPVLDEILAAVERVAEKYQVDLVLRGDLVLFASERIDLTEHVIKELDRSRTASGKTVSPARPPSRRSSSPPSSGRSPATPRK